MVEVIVGEELPTLQLALTGLMGDPYLRRANTNPAAYVDTFVEKILGLAQGPAHWRLQVWHALIRSLDKVFRPCESGDSDNRKDVLLLKKLRAGNFM